MTAAVVEEAEEEVVVVAAVLVLRPKDYIQPVNRLFS